MQQQKSLNFEVMIIWINKQNLREKNKWMTIKNNSRSNLGTSELSGWMNTYKSENKIKRKENWTFAERKRERFWYANEDFDKKTGRKFRESLLTAYSQLLKLSSTLNTTYNKIEIIIFKVYIFNQWFCER